MKPHDKVGLNLFVHQFWLADDDDQQYFGSGAFSKQGNFGFGGRPSNGKSEVATELDIVASLKLWKGVELQGGYSYIWDGDVWDQLVASGASGFSDDDVQFGYIQLNVKY